MPFRFTSPGHGWRRPWPLVAHCWQTCAAPQAARRLADEQGL